MNNIQALLDEAAKAKEYTAWGHCSGPLFGRAGKVAPIKALVYPLRAESWEKTRADAHQAFLRKCNGKEKERQQQRSQDAYAFDPARLWSVNIKLCQEDSISIVTWSGPVFDHEIDLSEWVEGKKAVVFNGVEHKAPAGIREHFKRIDGKWMLSDDYETPVEWRISKTGVKAFAESSYEFAKALVAVYASLTGDEETLTEEDDQD